MENIGGIFVVLICGLIIAVFVAVMEFVWSTRRSAETDEVRPLSCDRQYHSHSTVGYKATRRLLALVCVVVKSCSVVVLWCACLLLYLSVICTSVINIYKGLYLLRL